MNSTEPITIAILAGGHSRRMGTDKSFVLLEGKPLIQHVVERVAALNQPMIVITNRPEKYGALRLPLHRDIFPDCGSLGGLYTALHYSQTEFTLCVACDMPFLNVRLLQYLISLRSGYDAVVPYIHDQIESLHAVYHQNCLPVMRAQIERDQLRISDIYKRLHTRVVTEVHARRFDPELCSFVNLNTPDQLNQVQEERR